MPRLSSFLRDEIQRRDWSVEDLAKRAGISTSLAYQITRDGKDNVRQDTLARLAVALSMSPAELQIAAGGGPAGSDPDEIALLAYWRETVPSKRDTLLEIAASLRAKVHPVAHAKAPRGRTNGPSNAGNEGPDDTLRSCYASIGRTLSLTPAGL